MAALHIKVLGPGCARCKKLLEITEAAVRDMDTNANVEYVTSMEEIAGYVMMTPGLVIDETVVHQGRPIPNVDKVKALIRKVTSR